MSKISMILMILQYILHGDGNNEKDEKLPISTTLAHYLN